jgi:preprotein translocase subunit SecA
MRLFGGDRMKNLMARFGLEPGEPIYHPWLTKGIAKAQTKVEERNFEIRKHLLEYDDVLNEQRNFIYSQRDEILLDADLSGRVLNTADGVLDDCLAAFDEAERKKGGGAVQAFQERIKRSFGIALGAETIAAQRANLKDYLLGLLKQDIAQKEALVSKEDFNRFIRFQYIQYIDRRWLDHLEQLETLREAVYLRSYGSKTPLTEYKIEGFNVFDEMIEAIRTEIAARVFRVRIQEGERPPPRSRRAFAMAAQHRAPGGFDAGAARRAASASPTAQGQNTTVRRTVPKVGRNDPCPCGSGRKYKLCHGR